MSHIVQELLRPLLHDLFLHRRMSVFAFVLILGLFVLLGIYWPGRYTATATILAEQKNILGPLMEGAAVQTDIRAQAGLGREMVFGRKILGQVALDQGLINDSMLPGEIDLIFEEMRERTTIELIGENLIAIEYSDVDPDRTYNITSQFALLFIDESTKSKLNESQAAYEFIDKQVNEYALRLDQIADDIKAFRAENKTVIPGTEAETRQRIQELHSQIENQQQQIREAEVKAASLEGQLSGERQTAVVAAETDQIQQRIAALQSQLDTLLLSYHDRYPDVIALKAQIAELQALAREGGVVVAGQGGSEGGTRRDQQAVFNAVAQQLRQEQYNTRTLIETLKARVADSQRMLEAENERLSRIPEFEVRLAELNRDLEVNQTLYNDLIRRREYARVSMNVDQENQGLTLRLHEPAVYPTQTSGPRLVHFVIIGLFMAFAGPFGAILAKQQMDPKIRMSGKLENVSPSLPVLADIAHLATPGEVRRLKVEYGMLACVLLLAMGGAGAVGVLRLTGYL